MTRCKQLILLVDRDGSFRQLLRRALEKSGDEILEAHNRDVAVASIETKKPDIVLADIAAPESEGLEIIKTLRQKLPNAKIIAMSGGGRASGRTYFRNAQQMGANAVLAKPFSIQDLTSALTANTER